MNDHWRWIFKVSRTIHIGWTSKRKSTPLQAGWEKVGYKLWIWRMPTTTRK